MVINILRWIAVLAIALATAPAPALSIVNEFHAKGPVTDTLLPMTILDDVVGIAVFFPVPYWLFSHHISNSSILQVCFLFWAS